MDLNLIIRAFLSNVYKMTDGEIDAILNAPEVTESSIQAALLEKDKSRVLELTKAKPGQTFQDGYAKAKKEERVLFETELKTHFGIESDKIGLELMGEIAEKIGKPAATTEDEVKRSPVYVNLQKELNKQKLEWEQKWADRDSQDNKNKVHSSISSEALTLLKQSGAVFPSNPAISDNLTNLFLESLKGFDYELDAAGKPSQILKDGQPYTDAHGHFITFEGLTKEIASKYFEFSANNGGANGGNGGAGDNNRKKDDNGGKGTGYPEGIEKPKDFEAYSKLVSDRSIPLDKRTQISEAWESEQKAGTP